jgi:lysozyme family protein
MANFNQSYTRTAANEGGYQSSPADPGNYNSAGQLVGTNWGISAPVYEDWLGYPPSKSQMQGMTQATAKAIMKARFWNKIQGDNLPNQYVADLLFDGVVNHGRGVRLAQEVLGVTPDNDFGPQTFQALVNTPPAVFYNKYKERRRRYYYELVQGNPNLGTFLSGWLKRLDKYNDFPGGAGGTTQAGGFLLMAGLAVVAWMNRKTLLGAK